MKTEVLITGDGSPTLSVIGTGETYHSKHGALAESRHVFIEQGLNYVRTSGKESIHVFEMGFGTGLNAALTMLKSHEWKQKIVYHSLELFPPDESLIKSCAEHYPEEIATALLAVNSAKWEQSFELDPYFSLTKEKKDFLVWEPSPQYDVVYYDAFAPLTAPHLWAVDCFRKLASVMPPGAALVTFCAKSDVKRSMRESGFKIERLPGAPGKREMTRAIKL